MFCASVAIAAGSGDFPEILTGNLKNYPKEQWDRIEKERKKYGDEPLEWDWYARIKKWDSRASNAEMNKLKSALTKIDQLCQDSATCQAILDQQTLLAIKESLDWITDDLRQPLSEHPKEVGMSTFKLSFFPCITELILRVVRHADLQILTFEQDREEDKREDEYEDEVINQLKINLFNAMVPASVGRQWIKPVIEPREWAAVIRFSKRLFEERFSQK
ncbi:MAG: hypothetical protein HY547_06020 [Elusimicrobia bacterium]|nr:hypothetical protein [Elusimicrobiota bacterium]